jgi:hypothetical protein
MKFYLYLNWLNGSYWRMEYAYYLIYKGELPRQALSKSKAVPSKKEYYNILTYIPIGNWKEFTTTDTYEQIQLKPFGDFTPLIIFLYITVGAGYEIVKGIQSSQVNATLPFILFSFLIFIFRIGYAYESKATKTVYVDVYGAAVMLILLTLKLIL